MGKTSTIFATVLLLCLPFFGFTADFLFPLPGTDLHRPETSIMIRVDGPQEWLSRQLDQTRVIGRQSGEHHFQIQRSSDGETIVLIMDQPFELSEQVDVHFPERLTDVLPMEYHFEIRSVLHRAAFDEFDFKTNDTIPDDVLIPTIETFGGVAAGDLFLTPNKGPYDLMLYDNAANPLFWKTAEGTLAFNFRRELDDKIAYVDLIPGQGRGVLLMDTSFTVIDTFQMQNGYGTDFHDFLLFEDGHVILMSYDVQTIDMSQIVPGGNPEATVTGLVIQEQDANGLAIFEWRSWDHIPITDGYRDRFGPIDFTAATLSYVHGNGLDTTLDGNLILCSRHLEEVTKINRQTGDVMWRLGGKANQFTFINDTIGFNAQHHAQFLENGNLLLFDNGVFHEPARTRVVEYQVDEVNLTVTKVWEYFQPDDLLSETGGSVQRLDNGNTLIGWGGAVFAGPPVIHEVDPAGNIVLTVSFPLSVGFVYNYRVFKYVLPGNPVTSISSPILDGLKLYPNPAIDQVEIHLPEGTELPGTYLILDYSGRVLMHGALSNLKQQLNVGSLPEGTHVLWIQTEKGYYSQKLVKLR